VSSYQFSLKSLTCPLCQSQHISEFYHDQNRNYVCCPICCLVFVPPNQLLSSKEEKGRYDLHQNSPHDPDYRQFLNRLFNPMNKHLKPKSCGLDFGSGPGPTLSVMFKESSHFVELYDPFYANDIRVFNKQYDFITLTEVAEHLHNPKKEFDRLWKSLKLGGQLGVMTKMILDRNSFINWHYKNDPTHICFYARSTFEWLAAQWGAMIKFFGNDVVIFYK